jgi:hypothetical protein
MLFLLVINKIPVEKKFLKLCHSLHQARVSLTLSNRLLDGIKVFTSNLQTLCHKTIEDTLLTVRNFEAARLEYDANRSELELLEMAPPRPRKQQQVSQLQSDLDAFRVRYESLRQDVSIKLQLLNENRIKVMRSQLDQFQTAIVAYFGGSRHALEDSLNILATSMPTSTLVDSAEPLVVSLADDGGTDPTLKFESFLEK